MYNKKLLLSILKSAAEKKEPKLPAKDLEDSNSFMKKGGSLTANLQGTNRLFKKNSLFKKNPLLKKNPLFKKKNYKSKTYSPNAKLYAEGGEPCPDGMVFNEITKNCITLDEHQKFLVDWYENRKMPDPLDQENFQKVQPEILSRVNNFPPYVLSEDLDEGTAGYYDDEEKIIALNKFLPETIQEGSKVHENNHYLTSGAKTIKNFAGPHGYIVEQNIRKPKEINTGNPEWDKNLKNNYEDIVLPDEIQSRLMTFRKLAGFKADQVITEKDVEDYFKSNGDKLDPDIQDIKQITKDTKAVVNLLNGIVSAPVKSKDLQFAENGGITTQEELDNYAEGGEPTSPEEWGQQIKDIEGQIGNPSGWTLSDYNTLQNKLNEYKSWRENTPEGQAVIDTHNEEREYDIPLPEHLQDYTNAMMKARLAYANEFGNPAAKRMINIPDETYEFTGDEPGAGVPAGNTGTHFMSSMDNYAVPWIQQGPNGLYYNQNAGPEDKEAIKFDSDEDANYFAEHYKDVSPGFINEKKEGGLHKFVEGGQPCPPGYEKDYLGINCIPMTVPEQVNDEDWYKNWYANRTIQDKEGQELLETARPKILKRTENFPEIIRYSDPFSPDLGSFEPQTGKITLNDASLKNNPFRKNEVLFHEKGHYLTSPSLVDPETDTPEKVDAHPIQQLRNYEAGVVEEALKPRKDVPRKDRKYYDYLKGKGKNKNYTEEISKMLMGARRLGEFQPDQEITDEDIENLYKKAEEKGWLDPSSDFFSEPLYNLKEYTKSPEQIKMLFNKLAENKSDKGDEYEPQIAEYGGALSKFVAGGKPCPKGMGWSIKDNKCIKLINFTDIKNRVDNITYKPLTKLEDALDDRYKKGPKNSFSDFGKLSTEEKIKLKADNLAYQAQVDAEAARQAAVAAGDSDYFDINTNPSGCYYGFYWNGTNCVPITYDVGNDFLSNTITGVNAKIAAVEKQGMVYQHVADQLKTLYEKKAKIVESDKKYYQQIEKEKLAKEKLLEQERKAKMNPNAYYSETIQEVARNSGGLKTQQDWDRIAEAQTLYHQKRMFITDDYLYTHRDALVHEAARSIRNSFPNLTYDQALAKAEQDEALLYKLAEKHTPTEGSHVNNLAKKLDFYDYKNSRNDQIKSIDPNDPTHISFEDPGTIGGYLDHVKNIVKNPLDATGYAFSDKTMPFNYGAYEEMKEKTGYRDDNDDNVVLQGIDVASWFHPVGLYGQGIKMIEPTEKSIENLYNNPTWENAGTAAFDIGMTGLTFLGAKNPLKFLAEEKFAADAATAFRNWNPAQTGSTPPFNTGTGLLPVGVATEVRAASEAATGSTPLLNEGAIGFNPRIEIEGATVYNQLLEQQRLKNIAEIETPAGFQNRLFDSNIQLGSFEGKGHLSEVGYNYRTLGNEEIKAIQESKGVFPKAGKAKGGNENVKYWTKGNEKNWYAENPNQQVIRVKDNKFSTDKVVNANDVEIFNHKTGNFDPLVKDEVKLVANPKRSQELNSEAFSIYKGDKIVGEISGTTSANGDFIVYDVGVDAQFQKQGIGTEVYKQLNESLAPGNKVKSWGAFVEEAGVAPGRNTWQSLETQGLAKRNEKGIYEMLPKELPGSPNALATAEPFEIAKKRILNSSNNFNRIIKTNKTASTEPAYVQQEFAFPVETPIVPKPIGTRLQLNPTVPKIEVPKLSAKAANEQKIMKGMEQTSLASEQANALKASAEIPKTYPIINPDYFTYILSKSNVSKANRKFYTEIIDTVKAQGNVASEAQKNMLERIRSGNFNYNSNINKLNAGNLNAGNLNAGSYADELRAQNKFLKKPLTEREIEMYVYFRELERFDKLPKTTNKASLEVLENFKKRIKTSEGKKRMKALGIKNDKQLQKIEMVDDPNSYGYYTGNENTIALNPNLQIPELVRHEIEHGVGSAVQRQARINQRKLIPFLKQIFTDPFDKKGVLDKIERGITEIDDLLSGLELRKEVTPNKIWKSNVIKEEPVDVSLYKPALSDKQLATDYFATGSGGTEKSAFLGEVQQYMMDAGTIPKKSYVEITPEMVKQTMADAMFDEAGRGKYLRLFNIMKATDTNYKLVAKALNKMLGIAPLIGVGVGLGAASQIQEKKYGGALNKFVGGGEAPSTVWRQYTGTSWSEAKKQGLTDGSAKANLALRDRLLAGEFGEAKMSNEEVAARSDAYKNMVGRMISRGATLEELVARRIGTKEGLTNMFSELSTPVKEDLSKYAAQIKPKGIPLPIVFPKQIEKKIENIVKEDLKKYAATIAPKGIPLSKVFPKQIEKSKPLTTLNDAFDLKFKKVAPLKSFSNFSKDKPIVVSKIKKETPVAPTNDVASWIKNEQRPGPNIFKQSIAPVVPKVNTKSNFEKDLLNRLTTIAKQRALWKPEPISKVEPIPNSMAAQFSRQDFNKKYYDANGKEIKPILWDPDHTSGSDPNYKVRLEKEKARLAAEKAFIPVFDNSISTQLVDQELYGRQKQDNERYGKFMKRGKDIANRTDVQRNIDSEQFFADIAKPNSVIIDIGSALGNSNSKLAGVSVWELTQNPKIKQKKIKVIATDLPDQVESFKEHIKNKKAYNIDYAEVPMTFNTPIYDVLKTKNLGSTKDVYLRAANSIDLLMTVAQTKEHFYNIAKSLKDKNVTYVYNNMIFYKSANSTSWSKIGNINNAAFDHNSASWKTNKNRKPYALINDETGVKNPFDN